MNPERLLTDTLRASPYGRALAEIMAAALRAADPAQAVRAHLHLEGDTIVIGGQRYEGIERIVIVGGGKAGVPMAQAAYEILGERISAGLVVTKEGHAFRTEGQGLRTELDDNQQEYSVLAPQSSVLLAQH